MSAPDFAAVMSRTIANYPGTGGLHARTIDLARAQLAAKFTELCQTCGGLGMAPQCHPEHPAQGDDCGCPANFMDCPDCPTIGELLNEAADARRAVQP